MIKPSGAKMLCVSTLGDKDAEAGTDAIRSREEGYLEAID